MSILDRLHRRIQLLSVVSDRLANIRLALFLIASTFVVLLFTAYSSWLVLIAALGFFVGFAFSVRANRRVNERLGHFQARHQLELRLKATTALKWEAIPPTTSTLKKPHYLFDLNIIGEFSLLRLLNHTVSERGLEKLQNLFLSNDLTNEEWNRRQALCQELKALPLLRHTFLAKAGRINCALLESLLRKDVGHRSAKWSFPLLLLIQVAFLALVIHYTAFQGKPYFLLAGLVLIIANFLSRMLVDTKSAYALSISLSSSLEPFQVSTKLLERFSETQKPELRRVLEAYRNERASSRAQELGRISGSLGVRQNFLVQVILHFFFPWDIYWTLRLSTLQKTLTNQLPVWLNALAEFESYLSLATYAEANPSFNWPTLTKETAVHAKQLRHPLLSGAIANDLSLHEKESCVLITGSNMSGKSTFLRAIGTNLLLAKAGAPVAATAFELHILPLYTSISGSDSLHEGLSSFYAEVQRLGEVLVAAKERPIFFLIDEIFRGTNNRERLIGSLAYVQEITNTGSLGLVTTHDLELAQLEEKNPAIVNYHFRETVTGNKMSFSYHKERGPCPTTNALEIMRMSGLPISATLP